MIVFRDPEEIPADFGPSAVAIGKFDGVHAGHRAVIARLNERAAASGARAAAVTFDRNPLAILRPDRGGHGAARLVLQTCDGEDHRWMIYADLIGVTSD